jgi:hypothetical protein
LFKKINYGPLIALAWREACRSVSIFADRRNGLTADFNYVSKIVSAMFHEILSQKSYGKTKPAVNK